MFYPRTVATDLEVLHADATHWHLSATNSNFPDEGRAAFWREQALAAEIAQEVFEYVTDRHMAVSCHPDADCDHEAPGLALVLRRIPSTARFLTNARTSNWALAEKVEEVLFGVIGRLAEEAWHEEITAE
jgi:hypothetical protein